MKAILREDIIVQVKAKTGTEVGALIKGVGLERQRFDGEKVVDLSDLSSIWVRELGPGHYELHCIEVPNSQQVAMVYADRKNMLNDSGTIRVMTAGEQLAAQQTEKKLMLKNRLRTRLKNELGDHQEMLADLHKLVFVLAAATVGDNAKAKQLIQAMMVNMKEVYRDTEVQERLPQVVSNLKIAMQQYYADRDKT